MIDLLVENRKLFDYWNPLYSFFAIDKKYQIILMLKFHTYL